VKAYKMHKKVNINGTPKSKAPQFFSGYKIIPAEVIIITFQNA